MESRRLKLLQELKQARESLLDLKFGVYPWEDIQRWSGSWVLTFRRSRAFDPGIVHLEGGIGNELVGYQYETDVEDFYEIRARIVGLIDQAIYRLDQQYEVKPVLEDYIKRVKDTKLAEMLKEFNAVKDVAPNHLAITFRTILALVILEKAKRDKPGSKTASRIDLTVTKMVDSARTDDILSGDDARLLDSFVSTRKDIYDFVAHRPGADKMVGKDEVDAMVRLLNQLLPSIIN